MGKDKETEIVIHGWTLFFFKTNGIKFQSAATSLFDVQRWTFDVRRSSFKTTLYGINVTRECLQNNLALRGPKTKGTSRKRCFENFGITTI